MEINIKDAGKIQVLDIEGEIEVTNSIELKKQIEKLIDKGSIKLVINMGKVTYLDSSGIGTLVFLMKKIKGKDGRMKLTNVAVGIKKIFEMTGVSRFFEVYESEAEAIKSFAKD